MNFATLTRGGPAPLLSRSRASVAPPYHMLSAADRAIRLLRSEASGRSARLLAALQRPAAHNPVAWDRLFRAVMDAAGPDATIQRHDGRRNAVLVAEALSPAMPLGATNPLEEGIGAGAAIVLAGKKQHFRGTSCLLVATHHACARFFERSGAQDAARLHDASREAAAHARAVLVAHLDGGAGYRLRRGSAPVVLPAGQGAFLGWLRLHPAAERGGAIPAIEASTWVHAAMLDRSQMQARDVLLAGLPVLALLQALPEAWAGLRGNSGGDRRIQEGLVTVPLDGLATIRARLALLTCPPMLVSRIGLGLACPDTLAAELRKPPRH